MKRIIIILTAFLAILPLNAQLKIDRHLPFSGKEAVSLKIEISDSVQISTWDKNEVWVTASVNINDNKDNDAYETSFDEGGKTLVVRAGFKENYFKGRKNNCIESEITWQVFVPGKVPIYAESINADFTVTGDTGPLKIKSISGFIDLAVPEKRSASLDFSTISGTIYTDHSLSSGISEENAMAHIKNQLNNGGEQIKLETISGDIFFRKSE
jgi:hypothetical protein